MKKLSHDQTDYIWHIKLRNKGLENRIASFERGAAYDNIRKEYEARLKTAHTERKKLKKELAAANRQIRINRNHWLKYTKTLWLSMPKRSTQRIVK